MGWAEARRSFDCLHLGKSFQVVDFIPAQEGEEAFVARSAMRQISFQDAHDRARRLLGNNVSIELAPERGIRAETTANQTVITLDRIGLFVLLHFAGEEADLRNEMLRAGVMATGQMDIDRRVESHSRLAPACDLLGMAFGIGGRKLAAGIARARDETGADRSGLDVKAERF